MKTGSDSKIDAENNYFFSTAGSRYIAVCHNPVSVGHIKPLGPRLNQTSETRPSIEP